MSATNTGLTPTTKLDLTKVQEYIDKGWLKEKSHNGMQILCYSELATRKYRADWKWDDITSICRGLVVNKETGDIIAHCMTKFFNVGETEATKPKNIDPKSKVVITEKMDGSMITSFTGIDGKFYHVTKGSWDTIYSQRAAEFFPSCASMHKGFTFVSEIRLADEDKDPHRRVTTRQPGLYLITAFDRKGNELPPERLRNIATFYDLHLVDYPPMTLEYLMDNYPHMKNTEGYVAKFEDGTRIKFKTPWYREINWLLDELQTPEAAKRYVKLCFESNENWNWIDRLPEEIRKEVEEIRDDLLERFEIRSGVVELMFEQTRGKTKKQIAEEYKDHPYKGLLFAAIDGKDFYETIWKGL